MKKEYVTPIMNSELFVADEYVSACWLGYCNISGNVYSDTNNNGVYDEGIDQRHHHNRGCTSPFAITGVDITSADQLLNAFVVGEHGEWQKIGDQWQWVRYTTTTHVYNWGDHVATADVITPHERPNHS